MPYYNFINKQCSGDYPQAQHRPTYPAPGNIYHCAANPKKNLRLWFNKYVRRDILRLDRSNGTHRGFEKNRKFYQLYWRLHPNEVKYS